MLITIMASKQITKKASRQCFILVVAAMALISGCAAQGAKRVPRDRFDYNAALPIRPESKCC